MPMPAPLTGRLGGDQQFDEALGDKAAHAVVDAPAGQDHLRVIAGRLGPRGQIIGVDADAMSADEPRRERQKIPFRGGRRQHLAGRNAEPVEDDRQFVHQRDVEVALRILDNLRGFGDFDRRGAMQAGLDDPAIDRGDPLQRLLVLAGDDLDDGFEPVPLVAGIDALGRIAELEIDPLPQPRGLGEQRPAHLAGKPGINRRFEDDDRSRLEPRPDQRAGLGQRRADRGAVRHRSGSAP